MSSAKETLLELEREGKYVFHGSGKDLDVLEPRQAHNFESGKDEKDGAPAIFTTPSADYAILLALVNDENCPRGYRVGADCRALSDNSEEFTLDLHMSKRTLEELNDESRGFVYVFNKNDFDRKHPEEYVRFESLKPLQKIEVRTPDLSQEIRIIED